MNHVPTGLHSCGRGVSAALLHVSKSMRNLLACIRLLLWVRQGSTQKLPSMLAHHVPHPLGCFFPPVVVAGRRAGGSSRGGDRCRQQGGRRTKGARSSSARSGGSRRGQGRGWGSRWSVAWQEKGSQEEGARFAGGKGIVVDDLWISTPGGLIFVSASARSSACTLDRVRLGDALNMQRL